MPKSNVDAKRLWCDKSIFIILLKCELKSRRKNCILKKYFFIRTYTLLYYEIELITLILRVIVIVFMWLQLSWLGHGQSWWGLSLIKHISWLNAFWGCIISLLCDFFLSMYWWLWNLLRVSESLVKVCNQLKVNQNDFSFSDFVFFSQEWLMKRSRFLTAVSYLSVFSRIQCIHTFL